MAGRIRTIKPEILENERTATLAHDTWRLFVSMLLLADDHGNLPANPKRVEGAIFWGCPCERLPGDLLLELVRAELIDLYRVRGNLYAHIIGWNEHQKIDHPSKPRFSTPEEADDPTGDAFLMLSGYVSDSCSAMDTDSRDSRETLALDQYLRPVPPTTTSTTEHNPASASPRESLRFDFEAVYALYPRKLGKKRGLKLCVSRVKTPEQYSALQRAVTNYARMVEAEQTEPQYVKHFDTFMGCWEDWVEYQPPEPKQRQFKNVEQPCAPFAKGGVVEDF